MQQHECQQEIKIALMGQVLGNIETIVTRIDEALNGNGKPGLKTDVAQNTSSIDRIWLTIGGMGAGFLTILGLIVVLLER